MALHDHIGKMALAIILATFLVSCKKKDQCRISSISYIETLENGAKVNEFDTLKGAFSLLVYFDLGCPDLENDGELVNSLDYGSTKICLNKPFVYNGDTLHAGANLALLELDSVVRGHHVAPINNYTIEYEFYDTFFQNSTFDSALYQIKFQIETTDGETLVETGSYYFKN